MVTREISYASQRGAPPEGEGNGAGKGKSAAGRPGGPGGRGDRPTPVTLATIGTADIRVQVPAIGTVVPRNQAVVRARVDGPLLEVAFTEGKPVAAGEPLPEGLSLGEECEMKDPAEGGAVVKCQHQELRCDEIDKHLDAGKQVTKLALVFEDNLSFVLGDDLIVRKLKFLDGALDQLEHIDEEGRRAELDARFALQSGEIRRLFLLLEQAFKLSKADS